MVRKKVEATGNNKRLKSFAAAHSDTQFVVQFAFRYATLKQIPKQIVRRIGECCTPLGVRHIES